MVKSAHVIKNVIFDWSGVIGDDFLACHKTINDMFHHLGLPSISTEELRQEWQQPYMKFYNRRAPDLSKEEEDMLFVRFWNKHKQYKPHQGIVSLLKELKRHEKVMVVLTSNNPTMIDHLLDKYGLSNVFDKIYYSVHDKIGKIEEVMNDQHFSTQETLIIGDTPHEIEAGQAAGIKTCAITWGFKDKESLYAANPDYLACNIKELRQCLFGKDSQKNIDKPYG